MQFGLFTIIKDEQEYLDEWIQYHFNLGISRIFIYEDVFSTSHKDICDKYFSLFCLQFILSLYNEEKQNKIMELKRTKKAYAGYQIQFMYQILNHLKQTTDLDWVFYLDVDEFLTLENEQENLSILFSSFNTYDIIVLQWMNFNSNDHIYKPNKSVIESYTQKCQLAVGKMMSPKASSKLAFNLLKWDSEKIKTNHHLPKEAKWCKTNFSMDLLEVVYDKIYIRHYITKSFEEYCNKLYLRVQIIPVHNLNDFFVFNSDISKDNSDVQNILKRYSDMYRSGELSLF